jgi:hypothetical protein
MWNSPLPPEEVPPVDGGVDVEAVVRETDEVNGDEDDNVGMS